ncbi:protein phosphatase 2C domain-containing protein [Paenibacillus allorhizosphaerae]|uniref:PPM-type phosphatase domain-containing protein n=1 Tax=Paenibacillus allorhizosphaerae TaxID=2849866 RepID=A0ABM8VFV9_9BACL|nr:protein phosphatase 2C domain-containing protein [Paenibacillus allorhizosphaerae]CAG7634531.1 hypothetical protein PAECIP111802_02038 [Paenibacillus allorhizosphaerae]
MKWQAATRKSFQKREAEDAYVVNERAGVFGVFDGVTPMDDYKDDEGHNGAFIASNLFREHFARLSGPCDAAAELVEANRRLRERMHSSQLDMTQRHLLWSTCAVVAVVHNNKASYAHVGDCMIIALDNRGNTTVLTKDYVDGVLARAEAKRTLDRKQGVFVPEEAYFQEQAHQQAYQRWMANTPEGYAVANGMEEMGQYIQIGTVETAELQSLLLISDGMVYPEGRHEEVIHKVLEIGLEAYMLEMEDWERSHRVRPDDKTAILLSF